MVRAANFNVTCRPCRAPPRRCLSPQHTAPGVVCMIALRCWWRGSSVAVLWCVTRRPYRLPRLWQSFLCPTPLPLPRHCYHMSRSLHSCTPQLLLSHTVLLRRYLALCDAVSVYPLPLVVLPLVIVGTVEVSPPRHTTPLMCMYVGMTGVSCRRRLHLRSQQRTHLRRAEAGCHPRHARRSRVVIRRGRCQLRAASGMHTYIYTLIAAAQS